MNVTKSLLTQRRKFQEMSCILDYFKNNAMPLGTLSHNCGRQQLHLPPNTGMGKLSFFFYSCFYFNVSEVFTSFQGKNSCNFFCFFFFDTSLLPTQFLTRSVQSSFLFWFVLFPSAVNLQKVRQLTL